MSMLENFNRCPFCASHHIKHCQSIFRFFVECSSCKAAGPRSRTLARAINLWNDLSNRLELLGQIKNNDLLTRLAKMENQVQQLEVELHPPT